MVEELHVEAIHCAHFAAELAADDDVRVNAAFAREHHVVVFEIGRGIVNDGKVNAVRLVFKNANNAGMQVAVAAAEIMVKRALGILIARHDTVEVVRQLLPFDDDRSSTEILNGVLAEGDFEQAVVEDEIWNVRRGVIAHLGGLAIDGHGDRNGCHARSSKKLG